jgi:hypothetical protein
MALRNENMGLVYLSKFLMALFPQFEALNMAKNTLGTPVGLASSFYAVNFGTAVAYLAVILIATSVIFEYKKFENA